MNKDLFFQYVKSTRDCDMDLLDIAVQKGLNRAKSDRLDLKKLLGLATACAVTAALCITVNLTPFKTAIDGYFQYKSRTMQNSSEALDVYARNMTDTLIKYLGDG